MATRPSSSGEVSESFEGLLRELDNVRARLLEQHRRELDSHRRASEVNSVLASEAADSAGRRSSGGSAQDLTPAARAGVTSMAPMSFQSGRAVSGALGARSRGSAAF